MFHSTQTDGLTCHSHKPVHAYLGHGTLSEQPQPGQPAHECQAQVGLQNPAGSVQGADLLAGLGPCPKSGLPLELSKVQSPGLAPLG